MIREIYILKRKRDLVKKNLINVVILASGRMPCIEVGDSVVAKGREALGN